MIVIESTIQNLVADILYSIGITEKYSGFNYLSTAIIFSIVDPESLSLVTKRLYPDVAKHFNTNWRTVEASIRKLINVAWSLRKEKIIEMCADVLHTKPKPSQFISIITTNVMQHGIDFHRLS